MTKFRKRPVVIDAMQFVYSTEGITRLREFCGDALGNANKNRHMGAKGEVEIMTLEDGKEHFKVTHIATEGDWIIKGVQGEFYACKPDIFKATYERCEPE